MNEHGESTKSFIIDTNLLVAAVKPFSKPGSHAIQLKSSFTLLMNLILKEEEDHLLYGNSVLIDEYRRLADELCSETGKLILGMLIERIHMVEVKDDSLIRCKQYVPSDESADIVHAATCLETGAVLITNDRH